jgi:hypothetical protein
VTIIGTGVHVVMVFDHIRARRALVAAVTDEVQADCVAEGDAFHAVYCYPEVDKCLTDLGGVPHIRIAMRELQPLLRHPNGRIRRRSAYAVGKLLLLAPDHVLLRELASSAKDDPDADVRDEAARAVRLVKR